MEVSPAGVACNPRDARVKLIRTIISPTDDQPPPRKEREAVALPCLRQIRDGAGVGGRAREQLDACEGAKRAISNSAADHHLP